MEKSVYQMQGIKEYIPLIGTLSYRNRIKKHLKKVGPPKEGTSENIEYVKMLRNAAFYHLFTGYLTAGAIATGIVKGLEALIK